jgi:PAS domain S-box-containing protein
MHDPPSPPPVAAPEARLFALSPDCMAVVGLDGVVHRVNPAACALLGRPAGEVVGRPAADFLHPSDIGVFMERLARMVADADADAGERFRFRVVRPDGDARWLETRAALDRERGLVHAVGRDVTEVERIDERVVDAFAGAPLGMAIVGLDGRVVRGNAALAELLGRPPSEVGGMVLADAVAEEGWSPAVVVSQGPGGFERETRLRRADGTEAVALISATLVRNAREEPHYYVVQLFDVTARREEAARLAASETQLAEAQQIARLGSWEWDLASGQVTWSDELYRTYGVQPGEAPGTYGSYLDKVHNDDRARVARVIETAVAERRGWSLDYRIVRADHETRMIHARGEVVLDDSGRPVVVRGTAQDVTESRRVEDALRAAEQLFRRAFDDAPIGMALIDLEGRWLRLNRALSQMLGRTEQDLRALRLAEISHPEDRRIDRALIQELLAGRRRSYAVEKRFLRADGDVIHTLVHVSLMHGDGERPLYFLCQLVDITERRRAEAERRAAQARLQAIVDNSPALIFVKDLEHRYVLVNRRWEELFGVASVDALGRRAMEVRSAGRIPGREDMDREVIDTGETRSGMVTVRGLAGGRLEDRELLLSKFPLRDPDGAIYAVCSIATDVTERERSAREREELERRLAQAQRLESVGQLAGGVAHDFNNLLSVILTCVGFAQRELDQGSPVREDVDEIGRAADRAAALTRQLLMFSRREVVKPEVLDAGALVRDLERLLNRTLSERIALRIAIGPGLVPIEADRAQLEQVLVNLALNARDAMPDGGTLSIGVRRAGEGVTITVADDGHGMAPDVRERAFEPFFTTKEAGEGTGLGLATVHGIITEAGGTVDIASEPGRGTTVTIRLPRAHGEAPPPEEPTGPAEHAPAAARVMVVEDQDPVRRQAVRLLRAHGYEVFEAAGAEEALRAWPEVDVLVTDVVMPGMTGQELAQAARDRSPGLRVVFMSGHTEDVIVRNGARDRALAFVQKPFTRDSLLRAIENAVVTSSEGRRLR